MEQQQSSRSETQAPLLCRIRTVGRPGAAALARWAGLRVNALPSRNNRPESEVHGYLPDQCALMGVVNHLHDLGYTILYVESDSSRRAADSGAT